MMMGSEFTATVACKAAKAVACEGCGTHFAYQLTRTASAKAFAPFFLYESYAEGFAQKQATAEAEKLLAPACDPVPCPACGLVQPAMVRAARRERHAWMANLALGLFVVFGVVTLMTASVIFVHGGRAIRGEAWAVYATLGVASFSLWAGRRALAAGYDPNAVDRATRIHEGRTRAVHWVAAGDRDGQQRESDGHW